MIDHTKAQRAKVNFASAFPKAIHAILDGEPVRLTHIGDVEGMSPAYNVVDSSGKSSWQPQSRVQVTDQDYLPSSKQSLEGLSSSSSGSTSSTGRQSSESFPQSQRA